MRTVADVSAMSCPVCRVPLAMSDRQGIEIDYCPQCRGVWLDRGELDKIIERSAPADALPTAAPAPGPAPSPQPQYQQGHDQHRTDQHRPDQPWGGGDRDRHHSGHGQKKPKHWLSEIFD